MRPAPVLKLPSDFLQDNFDISKNVTPRYNALNAARILVRPL